jgi:Mce-associated membrane protein
VVGTAVESLQGSEATAIVYTNTTSTSPLSKNIPAMKYLSYRLQLKRQDGDWLVTKMTTVTSLDLTPQM